MASQSSGAGPGSASGSWYATRAAAGWIFGLTAFFCYVGIFEASGDAFGAPASGRGRRILGLMSEYWPLMGLFALVLLMIAGRLGVSLGLPGLFRDRPPPRVGGAKGWGTGDRPDAGALRALAHSGAFRGGFGVTILLVLIWTSVHYADLISRPPAWAVEGREPLGQIGRVQNHAELACFLARAVPPFLGLVLLGAMAPASAPGVERRKADYWSEVARYVLGIAAGVAFAGAAIWVGTWLHQPLERLVAMPGLQGPFRAFTEAGPGDAARSFAVAVMGSYLAFMVMVFLYVMLFGEILRPSLSPGHAICILGGIAVVFYSIAFTLNPAAQLPAFLAVGAWVILVNRSPYRYRYPGLDAYRRRPVRLADFDAAGGRDGLPMLGGVETLDAWWGHVARARLREAIEEPDRAPLLDADGRTLEVDREELARALGIGDLDGLRAWWEASRVEKPKLVLLAVTGAAYRSAFWTATVLDELAGRHPDLGRHVRVITGASGGMVGAAYAVAMAAEPEPTAESVVGRLRRETGLDSLSPVVRHLLSRDLPLGLVPVSPSRDRGVVLEEEWQTLAATFAGLRAGEEEGRLPSLIVSPMAVETGRRLLISNLDLECLTETRPAPGEPVYSRPAAEFFRVFPEAYETFRLATAVRMNAAFPYISPAVSLPTVPPRRVVDAGYYDNYGVDLACSWAYAYADWIHEHTSGLALLQVRAYPSEEVRKRYIDSDPDPGREPLVARWTRTALECLTTPPEAAGSARSWSMSYRNDEEIRNLDDLFHHHFGRTRRFFETFVFENPLGFAMNWFLSDGDLDDMAYCLGRRPDGPDDRDPAYLDHLGRIARGNQDELEKLARWWSRPQA